jgi:hypothetical protein
MLASHGSFVPKRPLYQVGTAAIFGRTPRHDGSSRSSSKAQALLEFALALPILLLVVYGLLEAGRLIFTYAAVATASRDAVRYASASGLMSSSSDFLTYEDCDGIRNRARNAGFLMNLQPEQVRIYWDHPGIQNNPVEYCLPGSSTDPVVGQTGTGLTAGDRVLVNVTVHYTLLLPLVPFTSRDISSGNTARTFMGVIDLNATP